MEPTATLLGLPQELRPTLLSLLGPKDRLSLRLTCTRICCEIDEYIGPTDVVHLHDQKSEEALQFYGETYFPGIEISRPFLFDGSRDLLYQPHRLKSISLKHQTGIMHSQFLVQLLEQAKGLTELKLEGLIHGGLIPREGGIMTFPRMKTLYLQLSNEVYRTIPDDPTGFRLLGIPLLENPIADERHLRALESWWESQVALISRITAPTCQNLVLKLTTGMNESNEKYDQLEIIAAAFDSLRRHPSCRRLQFHTAVLELDWITRHHRLLPLQDHSFHYKRMKALKPDEDVQAPAQVPIPRLESLKELVLDFTDFRPNHLVQDRLYDFLSTLTGLVKLTHFTDTTRPPKWDTLFQAILRNGETLKELVISVHCRRAELGMPLVPLEVFTTCPNLTSLSLFAVELAEGARYPMAMTFLEGVTARKLQILVLNGWFIGQGDFRLFLQLKNLKYMSLSGVSSDAELVDLVNVLQMRSLEGLILPLQLLEEFDEEGEGMQKGLEPFISNEDYVISDPVTPVWTLLENGSVSFAQVPSQGLGKHLF